MLSFYLFTLLNIVGSSWAYTPSGPSINLQAVLSNGATVYVENTADAAHYTYTSLVSNAAVFTLDEDTGYLFQSTSDLTDFPSGYAVPAVTEQGIISTLPLIPYDGTELLSATGYYPLSCSSTLSLGPLQFTVPLVCVNEGLANTFVGFGICDNAADIIENFGLIGSAAFLATCGPFSPVM